MGVTIPVEMKLLIAAVLIGFVQIVWAAVAGAAGGNRDFKWLAGPRDEPKPLGVVAGRLNRALANFLETFPLFAAALLACDGGGQTRERAHRLWRERLCRGTRPLCAALCARHAPAADGGLDREHPGYCGDHHRLFRLRARPLKVTVLNA